MSARRDWLAVALLLLLHFSLHPVWTRWPVAPDLAAGSLLLGSFLLPWGRASVLGCLLGILEASISLGSLGLTMLLFSVTGSFASWLRRLVYSESGGLVLLFVFVGTWGLRAAAVPLMRAEASPEVLLAYAPASAALTTLACWAMHRFVWIGAPRPATEGSR